MWRTRGSKYGNTPARCRAQNIMHHSTAESRRCDELHALQAGGIITDLQAHPQPAYPLSVNGTQVTKYIADFCYRENGELVVEDVKGVRTEVYALKAKLFEAIMGFKISEVKAR